MTLYRLQSGTSAEQRLDRAASRSSFADEPTGKLDSTNTRNIVQILRSLAHNDGCTVIIVTHDSAVAGQANIVLQMKDGS